MDLRCRIDMKVEERIDEEWNNRWMGLGIHTNRNWERILKNNNGGEKLIFYSVIQVYFQIGSK